MKKIIMLILALSFCVLVVGCKNMEEENDKEIDYTLSTEEILKMYSEEGVMELKKNFSDKDNIEYAINNLGRVPYNIVGVDMNGKEFNLTNLKGKNILLCVERTTCDVCEETIGEIYKVLNEREDIEFVNVFYNDDKIKISNYYTKLGLDIEKKRTHIITNENFNIDVLLNDYKFEMVPAFIFIDKNYRVSYIHFGSCDSVLMKEKIIRAFDNDTKLYQMLK